MQQKYARKDEDVPASTVGYLYVEFTVRPYVFKPRLPDSHNTAQSSIIAHYRLL